MAQLCALQASTDCIRLVAAIQGCEPAAFDRFYEIFGSGIRHYLSRHIPPEALDDRFQEICSTLLQSLQRGDVLQPERLASFISSFLRRTMDAPVRQPCPPPAQVQKMQVFLEGLPKRECEALVRFYLHGQRAEQICQELGFTDGQFRRSQSRAQEHFRSPSENGQASDRPYPMATATAAIVSPAIQPVLASGAHNVGSTSRPGAVHF